VRDAFHRELELLGAELATMCGMAVDAMRLATQALLKADVPVAERVLAEDTALDVARDECERRAQSLLALYAPMAGDLRTVLAVVYCAEKIERMGDLARHVAAVVRLTHPVCAVPASLTGVFEALGEMTVEMAEQVQRLMTNPSNVPFAQLDAADDRVDALHAWLMTQITAWDSPLGVPVAVNVALLGRFYERFADQAVSTARRMAFAAAGAYPG
jgi:phosphate transport system protein